MTTPAIRWRVVSGFPDLVDLYSLNSQRYPHLLESVAQGNTQSQFDILFAFPGKTLELDAAGLTAIDGRSVPGTFLDNLSSLWSQSVQVQSTECPLPFYGGWFVYLGYELVRQIEPSVSSIPASRIGPVAMAQRFKAAVIRSHQSRQTYVVWEPGHDDLAEAIIDDLDGIRHSNPDDELPDVIRFNEESPSIHEDRILRVLEFIGAGHTYQANLSRPWKIDFASGPSPEVIYRRLRTSNPAPFAVLSNISHELSIVSSSPERLVEVRGRRIQTRPIAGTYPRSPDRAEDDQLPAALIGNPKERAEHIMLVDLERNDLGRLCSAGTVRVDDLLSVESYRHVHHLVSGISGMLRHKTTPVDVLRAVFPGGTITGCPKIRTIEIIGALEGEPRGPYTGSVGYINRDGSMDFNILIRTIVASGSQIEWRAGGGIVADSIPDQEIRETEAKARGMMDAIGVSHQSF